MRCDNGGGVCVSMYVYVCLCVYAIQYRLSAVTKPNELNHVVCWYEFSSEPFFVSHSPLTALQKGKGIWKETVSFEFHGAIS